MREKLIRMAQSLIAESTISIHDISMSIFYTKEDKLKHVLSMEENLIKLDFAREILGILQKMEDINYRDAIQEYIDDQIDQYSKEVNSKDQLIKMTAENRKKILDFFVGNFY